MSYQAMTENKKKHCNTDRMPVFLYKGLAAVIKQDEAKWRSCDDGDE